MLHSANRQQRPAASSVEDAVVVGTGAGERGTGFIPGQGARLVGCGKAEGAGALQLVLQTPADEGRLLGYLARLWVLLLIVVGQTNHGVGLGQVPAEGGALGGLHRERWSGERGACVNVCRGAELLFAREDQGQ